MDKNTYIISLSDSAEYIIKASSEEAAIDAATEWFSERTPTMHVAIDNKAEPETEID